MTTYSDIVKIARSQIGVPWVHQMRINGVALDCGGLIIYVAKQIGVSVDDVQGYGRMPNPAEHKIILDKVTDRKPKSDIRFGDIAWIKFEGSQPSHFAIVGDYQYGGLTLIHAYNGAGLMKVIEHRIDDQWMRRIVGVWRFRGIDER